MKSHRAIEPLLEFPYLGNYLRLSLIEWELLAPSTNEHVSFVGSGPFPLTAIFLVLIDRASRLGCLPDLRKIVFEPKIDLVRLRVQMEALLESEGALSVELIDRSQEATNYAARLVAALGLGRALKTVCVDGESLLLSCPSSIIYIASMVDSKARIVEHLIPQTSRAVRFLIRGVEPGSLKELLYEPLKREEMEQIGELFPGFTELKTFWPNETSGVINSVHIFGFEPADLSVEN